MADYQPAFNFMIRNEDSSLSGIVQTDNDGGKVRYGLNSNSHPSLLVSGFYEAPRQEALLRAQLYYREWYWEPMKCDLLGSQSVANKVFDQCVPMGIRQASILVQRTLNVLGENLKEDGVLGPLSMNALNRADPVGFVEAFIAVCKAYYDKVILAHPEYADLQDGWYKRAEKTV